MEAATGLRFEILGPMRVLVGQTEITVSAGRDRTLLAVLLLNANQVVPVPKLIDAIWGERPPRNARNQLQGCVSRLRALLAKAGGQPIVTGSGGYRIQVPPSGLDLIEFRVRREEARAAVAGDRTGAVERYRAALALWRGSALTGFDSGLMLATAGVLDEERLETLAECVELELTLGKAGELVGELTELAQQYPYREAVYGLLMLALYRARRQADALAAYRRIRRQLHDELGTEPGTDLRQLHQAILNRDPELEITPPAPPAGAAVTVRPRELPSDVAGFTGRLDDLATLDKLLPGESSGAPGPVVISAIAGTAGVGKTALAVHWGHRMADRFPDGQLYINMHGYASTPPLRPIEALSAFLRSLGTPPERIPTDEAQASARYRTLLADRRMLVVLDNARSADQVRPLLPGSAGCLVLVTSRDRLGGLVAREGARVHTLGVLSSGEAHALVAQMVGAERTAGEPEATAQLVSACAHLPLALRIAVAHLVMHPAMRITEYVAQLSAEDRLAVLQVDNDDEASVLTALGHSYRSLPTGAARLFRLLGLVPCPDFTAAAAAALAGTATAEAAGHLETLASAHLLQERAPGRYAPHDLIRLYAGRVADADGADGRDGATQRLIDHYLYTADAAFTLLYGERVRLPIPPAGPPPMPKELPDAREAMVWLEVERPNLVAVVTHAASHGWRQSAWLLADRLRGYFWASRHSIDWLTVARAALTAATEAKNLEAQSAVRKSLADLDLSLDRYPTAIEQYHEAADLADQAGWAHGRATALSNLGIAYRLTGQLQRARDCYEQALATYDRADYLAGQINVMLNLATVCLVLGRLREAANHLDRALMGYRRMGSASGEASALRNLAAVKRELGELDDARELYTQSLALHRDVGDRSGEASALSGLAMVHCDAGRADQAMADAEASLALSTESGDRRFGAVATRVLGTAQLSLGSAGEALATHQRALDQTRETGDRFREVEALLALAANHRHQGNHRLATDFAWQALNLARDLGFKLREGDALIELASVSLEEGRYREAAEHARQALDIFRETEGGLGETRTLAVLARIREVASLED